MDHTCWERFSRIENHVEGLDLVVVMPNAHLSFYADTYYGLEYQKFFTEELPTVVQNWFPVSDKPEDRLIAGFSMGGYGAIHIALGAPEKFPNAASMSGALDIFCPEFKEEMRNLKSDGKDPSMLPNVYGNGDVYYSSDYYLLNQIKGLLKEGRRLPKMFACCGEQDFIFKSNLRFLKDLRAEVPEVDFHFESSEGIHNMAYWDDQIVRILEYFGLKG